MKIKMLTGMSGPAVSVASGDEMEVSDDEGKRLIKAGFAAQLGGERRTATKKNVKERRAKR